MSEELKRPPQIGLFGDEEHWEGEWQGMPEFIQNDLQPFKTLYVHFDSWENVQKFAQLLGQKITIDTPSIWYPEADFVSKLNKRYINGDES